jgi:Immunoglobulin I-set domain
MVFPQRCKCCLCHFYLIEINYLLLLSQEIFVGSRYKMKNEAESYSLLIVGPKVDDTGKYTCEINGISCFAFLNVDEPDPVYNFTKNLKKTIQGFTEHDTLLECAVSNSMAPILWYKGDDKLEDGEKYSMCKELSGNLKLNIKNCVMEDAGDFSCRIDKQTDRSDTKVKIVEYPYKFVKVLKSQQLIEKDTVTLACELDDERGTVKWFKGDEEIIPDKRVNVVKDGRKRKLVLKEAKVTDAGKYRCTTNADATEAEIVISCKFY